VHRDVKFAELAKKVGLSHSGHSGSAAKRNSSFGVKSDGQVKPGVFRCKIQALNQFIWKSDLHGLMFNRLRPDSQAIRSRFAHARQPKECPRFAKS